MFGKMLRRDLEQAADVMPDQLAEIIRLTLHQVVAHPRGNRHMLDTVSAKGLAQQVHRALVIAYQILADLRKETTSPPAGLHGITVAAGEAVHVGGGTADITDAPLEPCLAGQRVDLGLHGSLAAGLDRLALMHDNGAKGTAAEATAITGDGG